MNAEAGCRFLFKAEAPISAIAYHRLRRTVSPRLQDERTRFPGVCGPDRSTSRTLSPGSDSSGGVRGVGSTARSNPSRCGRTWDFKRILLPSIAQGRVSILTAVGTRRFLLSRLLQEGSQALSPLQWRLLRSSVQKRRRPWLPTSPESLRRGNAHASSTERGASVG